jgi:hypothetical protein
VELRLEQLRRIRNEIGTDPAEVPRETRKRFWKLVRQIKREPVPNTDEVKLATEIRNTLFALDRSGLYSVGSFLGAETVGAAAAFLAYLYGLSIPVNWLAILSWTFPELIALALRFLGLFFIVALLYPYGRLIAAKAFGIRVDGMCFDEFKEPTIKIDYETFLLASPPARKWFFFFSGLWTLILSLSTGAIGLILAGDILGLAFGFFLIVLYAYVIATGTTAHSRGEMAHYNREKKIERAWREKLRSEL